MKISSREALLDKAATLISEIAIPPFFSAVVFCFLSYYFIPSGRDATIIALLTLLFTAIIPVLSLVYLLIVGKVQHRHVPEKEKRTLPYLIGAISFSIGFVILQKLNAPMPLNALILASAVNILVITVVNFKWKISGHTIGAAAGVAGLQAVFGWKVWILYFVVLIVAWARVRTNAHTPLEVIGGAFLGFGLTFLQMIYYLNVLPK
jgi:membrane-associated phospholipid phosphatase